MATDRPPRRRKRRSGIKPWQWAVAAVLAVLVCGVLGVLAWLVSSGAPGGELVISTIAPPEAAAQAGTATPAPTQRAASPPTFTPPPSPQPTNTRVVSLEVLNQAKIEQIEREVVKLRQLDLRTPVPATFLTRAELAGYIQAEYEAEVDEAARQWALYQALGLAQPGARQDQAALVEWVSANINGFYDPASKQIYVVSDVVNMGVEERVTLAHEYTHALQDQHFDLAAYRAGIHTSDERLAKMALVEGDATVVMALYMYGNTTRGEWDYLAYRARFNDRAVITATGVSTRVNQILSFPYQQGAQYVVTLMQLGGMWGEIDPVYDDPPLTSNQVLHPLSFTRLRGVELAMPELAPALGPDWSPRIVTDTLGEFITSVHLDEFLHDRERAARIAADWAGDVFTLWETGDGRQAFAWILSWEDSERAGDFFEAYAELLRARLGPDAAVERPSSRERWYSGSLGSGFVQIAGVRTLVVWGPDRATVEAMLGSLSP
ncbi:MAG: hypothetical protein JW850_23245 [Thermoflexales bacterium]|nr:hypothetical protein [Thermoflexales bacterium]